MDASRSSANRSVAEFEAMLDSRKRQREVLAEFLDEAIGREGTLFVSAAHMGVGPSYVATVSLEWIRRQVHLANTMPLLKKSIDPRTNSLKIDEESMEAIMQRPIDWSREAVLAQYLIERSNHKFPPILAVISQPWVDEPANEMWDEAGRARQTSAAFEPIDRRGKIGLLVTDAKTRMYALDGQHRLIGINAALELVSTGHLDVRDKDRRVKRDEKLLLDDLIEEYELDEVKIQQLGAEEIGIEIIPAVLEGENREEAQRRVRSIFTHVNKQASPLTPGEIAQLDEDSGFAIVARRVAVSHPLFKEIKSAVNFKNSTISKRSAHLTTLQTLTEMARGYLVSDDYAGWNAKRQELARRPDDSELANGQKEFADLWTKVAGLPTFRSIQQGESVAYFRRFSHEDPAGGAGHLLLRPVGQQALAQAVALLQTENATLDVIFAKLAVLDERRALQLDDLKNPWWGVLYDPNGRRIMVKGREVAAKLLRHLLGGTLSQKERAELKKTIMDARSIGDGKARNYDGNLVAESRIALPEQVV